MEENLKDMVIISDEDAQNLTETIIATEASYAFFQQAQTNINITPTALQVICNTYMTNLKNHKLLWIEILNKYVGQENASKYQRLYRFNIYDKCIFLKKIEGCTLCRK